MADTTQNPLNLHGSDNPGIMLVIHQLAGNNFLSWKRSMIIALRAKTKYGFVNGDIPQPDENDEGYANWKKVDCMVLSWILNSLSKKIGESFLYADTTKELWEDICQRFGENNGPMRYKIQREISTLTQGNSTVMEYFNKLKKLWDEYACVVPLQICSEKGKLIAKQYAKTKLIQFLMGLNDVYDNVKNQIMLIDPLPSVNKAYSVLLTTERQITIQNEYGGKLDNVVMVAKSETYGKGSCGLGRGGNNGGRGWQSGGRGRGGYQRMSKKEKAKLVCEKCGMASHNTTTCFRIHGVPDWYKEFKGQQDKSYVNAAEVQGYVNKNKQNGGLRDEGR